MSSLFDRLSSEAKPYEMAVGYTIQNQSNKYTYLPDINEMDYDVYLKSKCGKDVKIEVKVHEGVSPDGRPYETLCLEVLEYQYRHDDYVQSHWMTADFDIMAHVDKNKGMIHFYKGSEIRAWAAARKHNARYSKRVKTAYLIIPWKKREAGHMYSIRISETILSQIGGTNEEKN